MDTPRDFLEEHERFEHGVVPHDLNVGLSQAAFKLVENDAIIEE